MVRATPGVPESSPVTAAMRVAPFSPAVSTKSMPCSAAAWIKSRFEPPPGTPKMRRTPAAAKLAARTLARELMAVINCQSSVVSP